MRVRILILVVAVLFFSAILAVPRIIEAKRAQSSAAANAASSSFQGQKPDVTVGESVRNDTSAPLREMKQQPVFKARREANENPKIQHIHKDAPDHRVQTTIAADAFTAANMPTADKNFNGIQYPAWRATALHPIQTAK